MNWKHYTLLFALVAIVFTAFPQIDLKVAGFFWNQEEGFYLKDAFIPRLLFNFIPLITYGVVLFVALVFVLRFFQCRFSFGINQNGALFLLLALIIGPGLIANGLLKEHWGRARPRQTIEFGGKANFTPALEATDQCDHNCSFIAGHPSMAFYTIAFAFLITNKRRRRIAQGTAISFGCLAGFGRIAQGGHFLSDVIFSGLITCGIVWLLYYLVVDRDVFCKSMRKCFNYKGGML